MSECDHKYKGIGYGWFKCEKCQTEERGECIVERLQAFKESVAIDEEMYAIRVQQIESLQQQLTKLEERVKEMVKSDINQGHGNRLRVVRVDGDRDGIGVPDSFVIENEKEEKVGVYIKENF